VALRRKVKDCEAAIAQADFDWFLRRVAENHCASVIGPAMSEGLSGALQYIGGHRRFQADDAKDSAHPIAPDELRKIILREAVDLGGAESAFGNAF
jgi:hypothetical protein